MPDGSIMKPRGFILSQVDIPIRHEGSALGTISVVMGLSKSGKDHWDALLATVLNEALDAGHLSGRFRHPKRRPARLDELVLHIDHQQSTPARDHLKGGTSLFIGSFC